MSQAGDTVMLNCTRYNVSTDVIEVTWTHPNGTALLLTHFLHTSYTNLLYCVYVTRCNYHLPWYQCYPKLSNCQVLLSLLTELDTAEFSA